MGKVNDTAKMGSLVQVESGEYSDYSVMGFFVVLRDFVPLDELALYLEIHPEQRGNYGFSNQEFLAFLVAKGYLLEINRSILYLGAYSEVDDVSFRPYDVE